MNVWWRTLLTIWRAKVLLRRRGPIPPDSVGRVRPAISLVIVWIGDRLTSSTDSATAMAAPAIRAIVARRISRVSSVAMPKPRPMIGIISGDKSIAPISTATDGVNSPSSEIAADTTIRNA